MALPLDALDTREAAPPGARPLATSRFLHLLRRGEARCLVHALTLSKVYGGALLEDLHAEFAEPRPPAQVAARLAARYPRAAVEGAIADVLEKGLLVADREEDLACYVRRFQEGLAQDQIQHLYFLPTTRCNLRCAYCFVEDEERAIVPQAMTREIAREGLDVFAKLSRGAEHVSINFYGGEPLGNFGVYDLAARYVRELERAGAFTAPVMMALLTNGTLVDDAVVRTVLETGCKVSVSLDGPEVLHDANRKDGGGRGSFRSALAGYRKLKDGGADPGISCTLGHDAIERIDEVVSYIVEELRPSGMGFNILLPGLRCTNARAYPYERAAEQVVHAFEVLRRHGIYEDRMMRRVRPFVDKRFHYKDCMGVGGQIVLTPSGRVGPCQAFTGLDAFFPLDVHDLHRRLDTLSSRDVYAHPMFEEWLHRFPLNMEQCSECPAIAVCGGGCPYAAHVTSGTIWAVDERVCFQAKKSFEWMIWDAYEHLVAERRDEA